MSAERTRSDPDGATGSQSPLPTLASDVRHAVSVPGCGICRIAFEVEKRALDQFLNENHGNEYLRPVPIDGLGGASGMRVLPPQLGRH